MDDGGRLTADERRRFDEAVEAYAHHDPYVRDPLTEARIRAALLPDREPPGRRAWWRRRP